MKTLILTTGAKAYFLRTEETATDEQKQNAELLGIILASQSDNGVSDPVVSATYRRAVDAVDAAFTMKKKVQVVSSQKLASMATAKREAES